MPISDISIIIIGVFISGIISWDMSHTALCSVVTKIKLLALLKDSCQQKLPSCIIILLWFSFFF